MDEDDLASGGDVARPLALACDCHAHVFGPFDRFPLTEGRPYTPPEAPLRSYLAMLDEAGFDRGVLVHPAAYGWDNRALLAAVSAHPDRLRGVAVVPSSLPDVELMAMDEAGVRGVRFTEVRGHPLSRSTVGRLGLDDLARFAPRLRALGWHAQVWADIDTIAEHEAAFRRLGLPIVFDHMGSVEVARGPGDPAFGALLRLVADGVAWIKLTVFRASNAPPGFTDARPFHDALVAANPSRLLWGSDWPFLGMGGDAAYTTPRLLATARCWWGDDALARQILVDNPAGLYGF